MKTNFFIFLTFCLFILFASNAQAQQTEKCGLELSDAPVLLGLRLGMSPKDARNVFDNKLKIKIKKEGTFFQNYIEKKPPVFLQGIRAVYLRFFDAKLYQIEIFYEPQNQTPTLEDFINRFSAQMNLSPNLWTEEYGKKTLNCAEFSLAADNVLNPRVELTDEILRARFEASQKVKDNKKGKNK